MKDTATSTTALLLWAVFASAAFGADADSRVTGTYSITVNVVEELTMPNTPLDPVIDFDQALRDVGAAGVLDPNSVEVRDSITLQRVPSALDDRFGYGNKGRVQWVARDSAQRAFEIRFCAVSARRGWQPRRYVPAIGTGDLLRYNAGEPRPIVLHYGLGLHDLDGDGRLDLAGAWDYAHRPGRPWGGLMVYPGVEAPDDASSRSTAQRAWRHFGEMVRLRFSPDGTAPADYFRQYPNYVSTAFADFNRDGLLDVVCAHRGKVAFFVHGGRTETSGLPIYEPAGSFGISAGAWRACRAVDLNRDGRLDLVVEGRLIPNQSKTGWPFEPGPEVPLGVGEEPCFLDLDGDDAPDAVVRGADHGSIVWRRNAGGNPPRFAAAEPLAGLDVEEVSTIASYRHGVEKGLIVQHNSGQEISIFRCSHQPGEAARFEHAVRAGSRSAVMSLSDQAWPSACDWDDDGDLDLLIGGGYGWPRIVINQGNRTSLAFAEPRRLVAAGKPIRLLRDEILGPPLSSHNMGYPLPEFVDWDADGLRDLVLANETNRIFWYKNVGGRTCPKFAARSQVLCDGYPDSGELRRLSATRAADPQSNNGVYPLEQERPFMWRTGPAFADFNGDGLMDLVTLDGFVRRAALFVQYRDADGRLRLKRDRELRLDDERPIDDRIVHRVSHWTESFRAVDWDRDGRIDLVYSCAGSHNGILDDGSIYLLRNVGSKTDPVFAKPRTMRLFGEPIRITAHGPHPWVGDYDGDGWADLIAAVEWSVYPFYRHAALCLPRRPKLAMGAARRITPRRRSRR